MSLEVVCGDILDLDVDAIVVPQLRDTTLFSELTTRMFNAAGYKRIKREYLINRCFEEQMIFRNETAFKKSGKNSPAVLIPDSLVVVTPGYNLKAKNAIHVVVDTVKWMREKSGLNGMEKEMVLHQCYNGVLDRAYNKLGAKSIAIPLLGTSLLELTAESSRTIAEDVINKWLQKKFFPLTRDGKPRDEKFVKMWQESFPPMTVYLVIPPADAEETPVVPAATPAPVYVKPAVIPTPHKTPEPDGDDDSRLYEDYDKFDKRFDKARKKLSGRKLDEYNKKVCLEYFSRIPNAAELANFLGFDKSCITRYKNYFAGLSNKSRPKPKRLIALAIGMRLNSYERYEFFRCATNMYPYDDRIFNHTEKIIRKGTKLFDHINKELCKIDPKFDLTNDKNEQKKINSAKKIG